MTSNAISPKFVIKNYGLMWRRDTVNWGKRGKHGRGALLGRRSRKIIDFHDQVGVYVLYDETRRPIYVGQTGRGKNRLFKRLNDHRRDHLAHRWQYFSWFGLLVVNKNGTITVRDEPTKRVRGTLVSTLNEIEGVLIAAMEPPNNRQGAKFEHSHLYSQVVPREDGVSMNVLYDMLEDMKNKVQKL